MNVVVFCSAQDLPDKYTKPAREFAQLLAKEGHTLVWGGSNFGIMKVIADAAQEAGGKIIGVSMEDFKHKLRPKTDEVYVMKDLLARKAKLTKLGDVFVALPGGVGTLDEMANIAAQITHEQISSRLLLLNIDNFYDSIFAQLTKMTEEGFIKKPLSSIINLVDTPEELINQL
ncbi:TIGR00730 family Rossman fold protein [Candidatus Saccharibacteria bacterium]|jgi:uncharacterized protein (TIGR00730 family)|nr:TIGR00730 family Rossman fold protein [Candidatus Saccharibacteria bacterium]